MIPQTLSQSKCYIITHFEQQLIGICQNRFCQNDSRKVCMDCLKQLHQNDKGFQLSDVMTFYDLQIAIEQFKQKRKQENAIIHKQCEIHKFLLLREIQEYISYWQKQYESWDYIQTILQKINTKIQDITLESYLNLKNQNILLYQFLDEQISIELNDIELILCGEKIVQRNEIKNDLIDNINEIINKMFKSTESNIQMSIEEMHEFMGLQQKNEYHALVSFERFHYFYPLNCFNGRNDKILERMSQLRSTDLFTRDKYNMRKICRMGLLYKSLLNNDQAIQYFQKLIDLQPQNILAYENKGDIFSYILAQILTYQGNIQEAIECLDQCIKINPQYEYAYYFKALILKSINNIQEAIECLDQCIKSNPKYIQAYIDKGSCIQYMLAEILNEQGNIQEEIECLNQCINMIPEDEWAYKRKADILNDATNKKHIDGQKLFGH